MSDVTRLLQAIEDGDAAASDQLWPLVYAELRQLAGAQMASENPGQTLDATALVHEAYLRMVGDQQFENRRHFFGAAAQAMRRIRIEAARRKGRSKRGGRRRRTAADLDALMQAGPDEELLALNDALEELAARDPQKAKLVELRFFGGLTLEQAAECLNVSRVTAARAWNYARAWLYTAMTGGESEKN